MLWFGVDDAAGCIYANMLFYYRTREVVNTYSRDALAHVLWTMAGSALGAGFRSLPRAPQKPIESTLELAEIVPDAIGKIPKRTAASRRRTFQAVRIEVNGELQELDRARGGFAICCKKAEDCV